MKRNGTRFFTRAAEIKDDPECLVIDVLRHSAGWGRDVGEGMVKATQAPRAIRQLHPFSTQIILDGRNLLVEMVDNPAGSMGVYRFIPQPAQS